MLISPPTELDYVFAVPTTRHMNYQLFEVLPYWIKTQILRKKGLPSPVLYKLNEYSGESNGYSSGTGLKGGEHIAQ